MEEDFACEKYGRKHLKYQNWRWKPHHCDLPSFNGKALLEKIKGKKLIFVGDSLNRNQWRSMLCLLDSYLPTSSNKALALTDNLCYFHATEYNATIGFYWSPMLVESNGDNLKHHGTTYRVVRIKSIEEHGRHWADADILVFDSFAWWMSREAFTILWGSFGNPNSTKKIVKQNLRPFEIALSTWSDWLEMNINRTKTKLFFMSPSPYRPGDTVWGTDHNCYQETEPNINATYWASTANRDMMRIAKSTIDKLEQRGLKVEYLNITELSAYREDAHPTTNRMFWRTLNRDELNSTTRFTDCLHWCLPGVPDVWNQILYAYIMRS
ncbi:protein trichome birefringence-like 34 [Phtheirospermum japonicum]|uniref:Protein trichome birefringence-like 34 n=1 Tax=Phtheirospermum japonicum TaxID=374723 RepID=A0A830C0V3_9LAMI|nr:protein trichome birefringence-like 34 [Phtheirospermum japonicum]